MYDFMSSPEAQQEMALASQAVNSGADSAEVEKLLQERLAQLAQGSGTSLKTARPRADMATKNEYKDITQSGVEDYNTIPNSPSIGQIRPAPSQNADVPTPTINPGLLGPSERSFSTGTGSDDVSDVINKSLVNARNTAGQGLLMAAGGLNSLIPGMGENADQMFSMAKGLNEDQQPINPEGKAAKAAALAAGIPAGMLSVLGSPAKAGQDVIDEGGSVQDAEKALSRGLAVDEASLALGNLGSGAGLRGLASRASYQVPGSAVIGAGSRALNGEDQSWSATGQDLGLGALGSLFPNGKESSKKSKIVSENTPLTGDPHVDAGIKAFEEHPEQNDLILPPQKEEGALVQDLFTGKARDASLVEAKRATALVDPEMTTPPQEPNSQGEMFGEQNPQQALFKATDEGKSVTSPEQGETIGQSSSPRTWDGEVPTEGAKPFATTKLELQAELDRIRQRHTEADSVPSLDEMTKRREEAKTANTLPDSLMQKMQNEGGFSLGEGLKALATNPALDKLPQMKAIATHLAALSERLGTDNKRVEMYNPDIHGGLTNHRSAAFYDVNEQAVRFNHQPNAYLLMHEATHAVLHDAIHKGEVGRLTGEAAKNFHNLNYTFEAIREHMRRTQQHMTVGDYGVGEKEHYGLSDIHEFMSELWSNGGFRTALKKVDLDKIDVTNTGGFGRLAIGKARNAYSLVVDGVRKMLGMPPKATNALEIMLDHADKFSGSINAKEVAHDSTWRPLSKLNAISEEEATARDPLQSPFRRGLSTTKDTFSAMLGPKRGRTTFLRNQAENTSGRIAEADARAATMIRNNRAVLREIPTDLLNKAVTTHGEAILKDYPEAQKIIKEFNDRREEGQLKFAEEKLKDLNAAEKDLNIAKKAIETARPNSSNPAYIARTYRMNLDRNGLMHDGWTARLIKAADKGETKAKEVVDAVVTHIKQNILPTNLTKRDTESLKDMYNMWTGRSADADLEGIKSPEDRRAKMINSIKEFAPTDPNKIDSVVRRIMLDLGGVTNKGTSNVARYYGNMRAAEATQVRSNVPEAVRNFWGEIHDPVVNMMHTEVRNATTVAKLGALNNIFEKGSKEGWLKKAGDAGPTHSEKLEGEQLGPLQGYYTTPAVKRAVNSYLEIGRYASSFLDSLVADPSAKTAQTKIFEGLAAVLTTPARIAKYSTVVLNPMAWAYNLIGAPMFLIGNGNWLAKGVGRGVRDVFQSLALTHRKGVSPQVQELIRNGLLEPAAIGELYQSNKAAEHLKLLNEDGTFKTNKLADGFRTAKEFAKEGFAAMDLWAKVANYYNDKEQLAGFYKRTGEAKTAEAIEQEAANRAKDTNPTYSRAPKLVQVSEKIGTSQYLTYFWEIYRNAGNNVRIGIQDIQRGLKANDVGMTTFGARRALGAVAAVTGGTQLFAKAFAAVATVLGTTATLIGEDDDRKKMLDQNKVSQGGYNMELAQTGETKDPTKMNVLDVSKFDPNDPAGRVIRSIMSSIGNPEKAGEHLAEAGRNFSDLLFANAETGRIFKFLASSMKGDKVTPSTKFQAPENYQAMIDWFQNHGIPKQAADNMLYLAEPMIPKLAKTALTASESGAKGFTQAIQAAGGGVLSLDLPKEISSFQGPAFKKTVKTAQDTFGKMLTESNDLNDSTMKRGFDQMLSEGKDAYKSFRNVVLGAKANGMSEDQIGNALHNAGLSGQTIGALLDKENQETKPLNFIKFNLESMGNRMMKDAGDNEIEQKKVEERIQKNFPRLEKLLDEEIAKYGK